MRNVLGQLANDGVSVVICCYNSIERIIPTLKHLQHQKTALSWELILVDNACTDTTVTIAKENWVRGNCAAPLKIVSQPIAGLTNARIKGVEAASFEYIIFCDDDNWLAENYIETAYNILNRNPEIGIAGGHSEGITDGEFPDWFKEYGYGYAVGKKFQMDTEVTGYGVWGAGMVSRKNVLVRIFDSQFPFLCLDRNKKESTSGGDGEICLRAALLGYKVFFCTELFFRHFIASSRLTKTYRDKLFESFIEAGALTHPYIRLWEVTKMKGTKRLFFSISSLLKLIVGYVTKSNIHIRHNKDYLYFITGIALFSNHNNSQIRFFYKSFN